MFELALTGYVSQLAVLTAVTADSAAPRDPLDYFVQYGVLGLVVIGFVTGWISPGFHVKRLETEVARLQGLVEGKLFPVIQDTNVIMEKASTVIEKTTAVLDRNTSVLERTGERMMHLEEQIRNRPGERT